MNNAKGRTSTIVIILIAVLLVSSTAIGFFMYKKESDIRQGLASQLEESKQQLEKLSVELRDTKKQLTLLQDKNKEADSKINNLMDEMELQEGLRNELKKENLSLKEAIEAAKKDKDAIRADLDNKAKKMIEYQELLKAEQEKTTALQTELNNLSQSDYRDRGGDSGMRQQREAANLSEVLPPVQHNEKVELDKIVVGDDTGHGRILSVDKESEFIICNLGATHGMKVGDLLSVYRGDQYLGDVKISRIQEEMSAADFVPPLSSNRVRKNDVVVLKQS